jgi:hypothetical protein
MAGRFEGLSDLEWQLFADLFPTSLKRGRQETYSDKLFVKALIVMIIR